MHVQDQYQDIIEKYVAIVSEKWGESVEDIILFGSVARGDAGEDSDIDLLIV
jgi:predicted nucleotidyltransferase